MTTTTLLKTSKEASEPKAPNKTGNSLERKIRDIVVPAIDASKGDFLAVNHGLHSHPETAYQEVFAHATLTDFLDSKGFSVQRHAYGLDTSFTAEAGSGGRLVILCAEYDALPGIGHGCGHNLIATSSVAAFVGAAKALLELGLAGRVRILGTPAEEGGGGKIKLIEAGAFSEDVSAAIMCHALPIHQVKQGWSGTAGFRTMASRRLRVEFHGKNAHAGAQPWSGINALDAAVATYASVSMLRQQIRPYERIQGVIEDGGKVPNIIPEYTRMAWGLRTASLPQLDTLYERVKHCIDGAAAATGCTVDITPASPYMELRVNDTLCNEYIHAMETLGEKVLFQDDEPSAAGTDMGNVSYTVPSFHGIFGIPAPPDVPVHHHGFAKAAGTLEAHDAAIKAGQAMAMVVMKVLADSETASQVKADFLRDQQLIKSCL